MSSREDKLGRKSGLKNVHWVAHFLGVSRNTVHQWVLEGHIPYINLGVTGGRRIIRFDQEAIEDWLMKRSYNPGQEGGNKISAGETIEPGDDEDKNEKKENEDENE